MSHSKNSSISDQLNYFNYKQPASSIRSALTSPSSSLHSPNDSMVTLPNYSLDQQDGVVNNNNDQLKIILPASDIHSPYHISLPYQTTQPTEELGKRFTIWKKIIKQLIFYFKELAMLRQHYYQLNVHMLNNIQFLSLNSKNKPKKSTLSPGELPLQQHDIFFGTSEDKFINTSFLPTNSKSVQGVSTTLFNYHKSLADRELQTYNDLSLKIIPRLENLKKSLNFKIKEIMNLKNDFKFTQLRSEVAKTGQILNSYINSVEFLERGFVSSNKVAEHDLKMSGKHDPYLLKLQLDLQLKKQLLEENYLKEAFNNLQNSGFELEKIIYKEIQTAVNNFTRLIQSEVDAVKRNLIDDLTQNFLTNDPTIDWNYYMKNDDGKNFLNTEEKKKFRKLSDITYPYQRKVISYPLRSGFLNKKNKVTKTYTKFYYVLTMNYLHEFKTSDRQKEQNPIQSFNLNRCNVVEQKERKIVLQHISKDKSKNNYTFKCDDAKEAAKWLNDILELTSFKTTVERSQFYEMKFLSSRPPSMNSSSLNSSKQPSQNSLNVKFTPHHNKSSSLASSRDFNNSTSSLSKQGSSSSLSKVLASSFQQQPQQDDPGKFTANLNLSTNNLVPSISISDHSPSSRHSSGSSVMTGVSSRPSTDYFNIKPSNNNNSSQTSLTMNIDKKLPYASGVRTPPKVQQQLQQQQFQQLQQQQQQQQQQKQKQKQQFKLNLPSQNLNKMMVDEFANGIKTPGELPQTSIGDIINGFQNQKIEENKDE